MRSLSCIPRITVLDVCQSAPNGGPWCAVLHHLMHLLTTWASC